MKIHRLALVAAFASLAFSQVQAEQYQGVIQVQSTRSRSDVNAEAVEAAHAANPYADAASSGVFAALVSPRDRATVQAEARVRAHAPNQNLHVEAFVNSRIPDDYNAPAGSMRQTRNERTATLR
jgi:hypothetical protein